MRTEIKLSKPKHSIVTPKNFRAGSLYQKVDNNFMLLHLGRGTYLPVQTCSGEAFKDATIRTIGCLSLESTFKLVSDNVRVTVSYE